ncbi:hypothetical protein ACFY9A_29005 [Streptomyces rubradiris]
MSGGQAVGWKAVQGQTRTALQTPFGWRSRGRLAQQLVPLWWWSAPE